MQISQDTIMSQLLRKRLCVQVGRRGLCVVRQAMDGTGPEERTGPANHMYQQPLL